MPSKSKNSNKKEAWQRSKKSISLAQKKYQLIKLVSYSAVGSNFYAHPS